MISLFYCSSAKNSYLIQSFDNNEFTGKNRTATHFWVAVLFFMELQPKKSVEFSFQKAKHLPVAKRAFHDSVV